jgi:hypothetical protein
VVENSQNSAKKGKRSTTKTSEPTAEPKFTLADALEILSQSFGIVEDAGAKLLVSATDGNVIVTIQGVDFVAGVIVPHAKVPQSDLPQTGG